MSNERSPLANLETKVELVDIRTMMVKAARYVGDQESQANAEPSGGEFDVALSWRVGKGEEHGFFAIELSAEMIGLPQGQLELTLQGRFQASDYPPEMLSFPVIEEYGAMYGIPILYPFLRQEIMDSSRRVLNAEVLLPLVGPSFM